MMHSLLTGLGYWGSLQRKVLIGHDTHGHRSGSKFSSSSVGLQVVNIMQSELSVLVAKVVVTRKLFHVADRSFWMLNQARSLAGGLLHSLYSKFVFSPGTHITCVVTVCDGVSYSVIEEVRHSRSKMADRCLYIFFRSWPLQTKNVFKSQLSASAILKFKKKLQTESSTWTS